MSSFTRLAAVEMQLVMQLLDWRSIIALGRTCSSSLRAASSSFAWLHCAPASLRWTPARHKRILRGLERSRMMCHTPLAIIDPPIDDIALLVLLAPRIRLLDLRKTFNMDSALLDPLFTMGSDDSLLPLRGLTELRIGVDCATSFAMAKGLVHCTVLHTLDIHLRSCYPLPHVLHRLPALTSLRLDERSDDGYPFTFDDLPAPISQCLGLRELILCAIDCFTVSRILCVDNLSRTLRTLVLEQVVLDVSEGDPPIAWAQCWRNLHSLHSLSFDRCISLTAPLRALHDHPPSDHRPPSLTELRVSLSAAELKWEGVNESLDALCIALNALRGTVMDEEKRQSAAAAASSSSVLQAAAAATSTSILTPPSLRLSVTLLFGWQADLSAAQMRDWKRALAELTTMARPP
jgi:hypothetical protein